MSLPPLVSNLTQALASIRSFQHEITTNGGDNELVRTLGHFRAFYVIRENGVNLYAPSKYCGVHGLTADRYGEVSDRLDGRRTEVALRPWFVEVADGPERDELMAGLHAYLARFGKKPSTLARVSVLRDEVATSGAETTPPARLAEALLTLFRSLPAEAQSEFRRLLRKEA